MNKEPVFSAEYDIGDATTSQPSIQKKGPAPEDEKTYESFEKIELDYELSKPKRILIHARIIPK